MKKIFIVIIVSLILGAFSAYAVKDIRLSNTKMKNVCIELTYNPSGQATAEITTVYEILNDDGTFSTIENKVFQWGDLPSTVQNNLDGFLKHLDKEFRTEKIDEKNSTIEFE